MSRASDSPARRAARLLSFGMLLLAAPAASQPAVPPPPRFPAEQPVALSARVALLEQRVYGLDQRLKAYERVGLVPRPDGSYQLLVNSAKLLIARDGTVAITPAPAPAKGSLPVEDPCDPPYTVDPKGRRGIKPECLQVGPCEPPYTVDPQGVRIPKKECL